VNAISGLSIGRRAEDREFYKAMKLPRYAPPGWLFPPVWAINNAFTLWGNLRLLNQHPGTPGRREMLALQGASWALFSTFAFVYFRKRSPILAATWTASDWVLTTATVAIAAKHGQGDIVKSQATKFAWLSLAVPVSGYQALHNPDPVFATHPDADRMVEGAGAMEAGSQAA
jgi:tryptophan-rich sensory protein